MWLQESAKDKTKAKEKQVNGRPPGARGTQEHRGVYKTRASYATTSTQQEQLQSQISKPKPKAKNSQAITVLYVSKSASGTLLTVTVKVKGLMTNGPMAMAK